MTAALEDDVLTTAALEDMSSNNAAIEERDIARGFGTVFEDR